MQVKLVKGMFETETYELEITEDSLIFSNNEKNNISIPFSELRSFNISGNEKDINRFVLESSSHIHEGRFLCNEGTDKFINKLKEKCGIYMDIRIDIKHLNP